MRARTALLVLIHLEMGQQEEAAKAADRLLSLVTQSVPRLISSECRVRLFDFRPQRPRAVGEVDGGLAAIGGIALPTLAFLRRRRRNARVGRNQWGVVC